MKNPRLVLLGPPASGKGTQGELMARRWGVPVTSTGEVLRREKQLGTALGEEADRFTSRGCLAPDELVVRSVESWLEAEVPPDGGFILDGTPRTVGQAHALEEILARRRSPLTAALFLEVTLATISERVRCRVVCTRCGRSFQLGRHVAAAGDGIAPGAVCPVCAGALERRRDDTAEALEQRLQEYEAKTKPVAAFYQGRDQLRVIPAEGSPEETFAHIVQVVEPVAAATRGEAAVSFR